MSDTQPLLVASNKSTNIEDGVLKKKSSTSRSSDWRQLFSKNGKDDGYEKLDDDPTNNSEGSSVRWSQLFSFANRTDVLMTIISVTGAIIHGVCLAAYIVVFARLIGTFAQHSFDNSCKHQQQNLSIPDTNNNGCSLDVELNATNYAQFQKLCNVHTIIPSMLLTPSMDVFRANVMSKVYALFIIATMEFVLTAVKYYFATLAAKRQTSRISVRLFQSLIHRNINYFDTNSSDRINARLFDYIENINKGIGFEFTVTIGASVCATLSLIIVLYINWKLTVVLLCTFPFYICGRNIFTKLTANETTRELATYSKAGHIAQEVFSSIRTVFSLNGGKFEQERYEKELEATRWSSVRKGAAYGIFTGWIFVVNYVICAIGFFVGSLLMDDDKHQKINLSDVFVIVTIFVRNISLFGIIGPFLQSLAEAQGAAEPVFRLIDQENDASGCESQVLEDSESETESIDINGDIEFTNVNFVYPGRQNVPILRSLNLIARVGETTALIGSSGCGKSTCISLLLRYYEPTSGQITINGRSIANFNVRQLRQNIGIVSQEPILFDTTIYENIRYGKKNATKGEIEEAAREANAHQFIMQLPKKYETRIGEFGVQLSGGEKQRIALARALVKKPTLLILDEATSALDNTSEQIVQKALDKACQNRTTIVIAHRLTTIQNAHHIYVLDKGDVIEEGTHETLMAKKSGKYQEIVKAQCIEKIENEIDVPMTTRPISDDEKRKTERSRLLSIGHIDLVEETKSKPIHRRFIFLRLLSMNRSEWLTMLIGCIACVAIAAIQPIFSILLAKMINVFKDCTHSNRSHQVLIVDLYFIALGIFMLIVRFCQFTSFAMAGSKLTKRLRAKAFSSLLRQEVAYFDKPENNSGAVCGHLSSDALAIQHMTGTRLSIICEILAMFFLGLVFGFYFKWPRQIMLAVFLPFLVTIGLHYTSTRLEMRRYEHCEKIIGQANSLVVEVIHNIRTVKQLTMEKEFLQQYTNLIHQSYIVCRKYCILSALFYGFVWALSPYIMAELAWCSLNLLEKDELDTSNIIMILTFANIFVQSVTIVSTMVRDVGNSLSAAKSFFNLFDRKPTIDNSSIEGQTLDDFRGEIEFDQVKFAYPTRPTSLVLNNLQLSIKPGQRVALVGTSGCGKSTLIQLLERFYDVTSGQVRLGGVDIRQLNIQWIRSRLGLVSQEPVLFDLTIAENIAYGKEDARMEDIVEAALKANIHEFVQKLPQGYETRVGMRGIQLSGGEKQRIAIARALLRRPKILLLDEATSAMDSYNEQLIQQSLGHAQTEDPSRTSINIAHRLSTVVSCDLICVLHEGRVVESGTHTELMQQCGAYYRMHTQNIS